MLLGRGFVWGIMYNCGLYRVLLGWSGASKNIIKYKTHLHEHNARAHTHTHTHTHVYIKLAICILSLCRITWNEILVLKVKRLLLFLMAVEDCSTGLTQPFCHTWWWWWWWWRRWWWWWWWWRRWWWWWRATVYYSEWSVAYMDTCYSLEEYVFGGFSGCVWYLGIKWYFILVLQRVMCASLIISDMW